MRAQLHAAAQACINSMLQQPGLSIGNFLFQTFYESWKFATFCELQLCMQFWAHASWTRSLMAQSELLYKILLIQGPSMFEHSNFKADVVQVQSLHSDGSGTSESRETEVRKTLL